MSQLDTFFSFDALLSAPASNINAVTRKGLLDAVLNDEKGRFEPLVAIYDMADKGGHAIFTFPHTNKVGNDVVFSTNHPQHTWDLWHAGLQCDLMRPHYLYHFFCVRQPTDRYKNLFPLVCVRIWDETERRDFKGYSKQAMLQAEMGKEEYVKWCAEDNARFLAGN